MSASKNRMRWTDLPPAARAEVERLAGGAVVGAENCPDGFSPGMAARLTLAGGRRVFVKAIDATAWPGEQDAYRAEAAVSTSLPDTAPAPRCLGTYDDGRWIIIGYEHINGRPPHSPWAESDLVRVLDALDFGTAPPGGLARDHPRLGGWTGIDPDRLRRSVPWAYRHLDDLIALEREGMRAAQGESFVHFDLYAHNILLTADRVVIVDWPHARLGSPLIDRVMLLSSAAADGIDPEPYVGPAEIDSVLAAHAGFCLNGGLSQPPPGLEPIVAAKLAIGLAATGWLRRRLSRAGATPNGTASPQRRSRRRP
jgi:hypothetical protein